MGASVNDTSIKITSNGEVAFYSSYKGCGNILIEPKFGIYSNKKPIASEAFNFLEKSDWWDGIAHLDKQLKSPVYGRLEVNFDTKEIISNFGYGHPTGLFKQWLQDSVQNALDKREGYLTAQAINYHFKHKNFMFMDINEKEIKVEYPKTMEEFSELLKKILHFNAEPNIFNIQVAFPDDWKLKYKKYTRK